MSKITADFGNLYRAAFAERDPAKKLVLLSAVQKAIVEWEQSGEAEPNALRLRPQSVASLTAASVA